MGRAPARETVSCPAEASASRESSRVARRVLDWVRMSGPRAMAILAALLCSAAGGIVACGIDSPRPPPRGQCSPEEDPRTGCEPVALASAEEACWRLVECGAVPVANPESDPGCCFDWGSCVNRVESMADEQFELALACVESSSCEELRPIAPGALPRCLE
jgi:hypothetical protein